MSSKSDDPTQSATDPTRTPEFLEEQAKAQERTNKDAEAKTPEDRATERAEAAAGLYGAGTAGEPETEEQGLVRTGRALPAHAAGEDSAGLVPEDTERRVEQTHAVRDETNRVVQAQGHRADGDGASSTGPEAPRSDAPTSDQAVADAEASREAAAKDAGKDAGKDDTKVKRADESKDSKPKGGHS